MHRFIISEDDESVEVGGCSLIDILEDIQDEFYEEYQIFVTPWHGNEEDDED